MNKLWKACAFVAAAVGLAGCETTAPTSAPEYSAADRQTLDITVATTLDGEWSAIGHKELAHLIKKSAAVRPVAKNSKDHKTAPKAQS